MILASGFQGAAAAPPRSWDCKRRTGEGIPGPEHSKPPNSRKRVGRFAGLEEVADGNAFGLEGGADTLHKGQGLGAVAMDT